MKTWSFTIHLKKISECHMVVNEQCYILILLINNAKYRYFQWIVPSALTFSELCQLSNAGMNSLPRCFGGTNFTALRNSISTLPNSYTHYQPTLTNWCKHEFILLSTSIHRKTCFHERRNITFRKLPPECLHADYVRKGPPS